MNRKRPSFMLAALAAVGSFLIPAKAVPTDTGKAAYEALQRVGKKKPRPRTSGFGSRLPFKVWKNILNKKGKIANCCFSERPHCSKHLLRYKHLRYRAVYEDETSGLRRSIKAKAFACPKCLRAA